MFCAVFILYFINVNDVICVILSRINEVVFLELLRLGQCFFILIGSRSKYSVMSNV